MNRESSQGAHNVNVFDDIQSLCSDFRRQLKKGERRRIEDYLGHLDETAQQNLFQNLLHIDLEFRRRQQGDPSSDEYVARFPQFGKLIRQAFFESTMMSREMVKDTPADEQTIVLGLPAACRLGEYELLRELGRGGFGVVYEARHLHRNDLVALKTLPTALNVPSLSSGDAERLHKFRHEFRSLSEVNHPNLVGMQTLEVDGDQWFFTMDLINGVDFLDYVRPHGQLNEARIRATLKQLVPGILALHEQGIVHRDLKPNNVLVNADGHVVILDFGLVAELQQQTDQTVSMQSQQFAGTPRYAAPEQAVGTRTTATDWYALGVMLYEALTNEAPFKGSAVQVILKKQNEAAPTLSGKAELPQDLAELVDGLLRRDPQKRPDAAAVCDVFGIVDETASHDSSDSSLISGTGQSDVFLIGRESQLAELESAHQELSKAREPVVVFISGRSGEGKTSLAEKFLTTLRRDGNTLVLSGRCYDRESVPYKAIDPLIDALVSFLRSQSDDRLHEWLPDDIHMLAHLFPILKRVQAIADRSAANISHLDDRQIRYRGFYALKDLFNNIGQQMPIVLFTDDLQWGDGDSAEALFDILSPPDPPKVLLLGSFRSDETETSSFLQEWNRLNQARSVTLEAVDVEVEPLTEEQCLTLLATQVGLETEQLKQQAAELFDDTRGNPYFLEQLIEGFNPETKQFTAVPLNEIIDRKLTRLPEQSAELLRVIAIAGQAVSMEEASQVAGYETPLYSTITHMRSERLVRLIGSIDQQLVDTYHDKIRETVLNSMSDAERQQRHLELAETIEANERLVAAELLHSLSASSTPGEYDGEVSARVFDLAHHFSQAGDDRAFVYQLLAAEQSLKAYATEDALQLYDQAERLLPNDAPPMLRYRLCFAMGRVFLWNHDVGAAIDRYQQAVDVSENNFDRSRANAGLGHVKEQVAKFDQAIKHYDTALEQLSMRRPRSSISKILSFGKKCFQISTLR